MTVLQQALAHAEYLTRIRQHLHQHPEIGFENVIKLDRPLMGSEDFAYYLGKIPAGGIFRLGVGGGKPLALHNPLFDFPDAAIPVGVAAMTQFALQECQ